MNAFILAAAVVCQWDMTPRAKAWDMTPPQRVAVVKAVGYPARGGPQTWVYINGRPYSASVEHLLQGEHAGQFDEGFLRSLSQEDLDWLHSHHHHKRVDWSYAKRPGEFTKPAETVTAAAEPKRRLVRQTWCVGGRCYYKDVWVVDQN